jgi:hypothetical protein
MPNWVRLKFGQQVNKDIILLHKKFQRNPHHRFIVTIKYLEATATGNEFAVPLSQFATPVTKHQKPFSQPLKWYEKPHGVPSNPGLDADVCECEHRCLQADQPPMLLFNQFTAPNSKSMVHFKETIGLQFYVLTDLVVYRERFRFLMKVL